MEEEKIKLNLGCGPRKMAGYVNVDNRSEVKPDKVLDVQKNGLKPWDDNSVDEVRAYDFLEHIVPDKVVFVIDEIWRVLKPGGKFEHFTPSTDGRGAFQDPTHRSFWNINSWFYWSQIDYHRLYNFKAMFQTVELRDIVTDMHNKIVHTLGVMVAVKPEAKDAEP